MMWALLAAKVDPDSVNDELCPLDRGSPVTGCRRRALGDDVTVFQLALPVPQAAVIVGARDSAHEAAAGPKIELDAPLVVAFTEVEAVTVDLPGPLFGCQPAVTVHDHSRLAGEPGLQLGIGGLLGLGDSLAFG